MGVDDAVLDRMYPLVPAYKSVQPYVVTLEKGYDCRATVRLRVRSV